MNFQKFFGYGLLFAVSTALLHVVLTKYIILTPRVFSWTLWFSISILAIALSRRLGVISYLEAGLIGLIWTFFRMFLDLLITSQLLGGVIFYKNSTLWISYGLMLLVIFLFHKKRHIHIRRKLKTEHSH